MGAYEVSDAERALLKALRQAHRRAGEPSSRAIATAIGGMSHTTVNSALKGTKIPSWPVLARIIEELGGDLPEFQRLWIETRENPDDTPASAGPGSDVSVFVSYARVDDEATHGRVSQLVKDIGNAYQSMTGHLVGVFFDIQSISLGENWRDRIRLGLSSSSIFLAFVSPAFLRSAQCREELNEFFGFLDANSSARLVMPLLYADRERIEKMFASDPLWSKITQRQATDISHLRFVDIGSAEWVRETTKIAELIEDRLADFSSIEGTDQEMITSIPSDEVSDGMLERFAEVEDRAPQVLEDMNSFTQSLQELSEVTNKATPGLNKATSFSQRLAVTNSLASTLTPIANKMRETAERLVDNYGDWDQVVNYVIGQAKADPHFYDTESNVEFLATVGDLATAGVESLASVEELDTAIGGVLGLSKRLNIPLRTIREACLSMADIRGLLMGWKAELETLEESQ
ncbi:toll/interleukin-1 receptor domain-containing protein [Actinoplanes sp. NPDC000266]